MSTALAYNPDDTVQSGFLAALAQGETGGNSFSSTEGVGGANLAGSATDQYGFPIWNGEGNSHAAGTYQFQPSTWDSIASQFGLNFSNASDQSAGAWYYAEQVFSQNTGGQSLETALQNGEYSEVQTALQSVWPSVTGNQAAPQGLAANLGAAIAGGGTATSGTSSTGTSTSTGSSGTASQNAGNSGSNSLGSSLFSRAGLIIVGSVVIVVALWMLLSSQGYVPSPKKLATSVL